MVNCENYLRFLLEEILDIVLSEKYDLLDGIKNHIIHTIMHNIEHSRCNQSFCSSFFAVVPCLKMKIDNSNFELQRNVYKIR